MAGRGHQPAGKDQLRSLEVGQALFRQGDAATAIFRLETGLLNLLRHTEAGAAVLIHVARPGETFAEAALFSDTYHCDAIAQAPSRVVVMRKQTLLDEAQRDPQAMLWLAQVLARQVRELRTKLEIRNIRSADQRLLAWLRLKASGNPPCMELDCTWTQIADEVGLTREATYRALSKMRQAGCIKIEGRRVCFG